MSDGGITKLLLNEVSHGSQDDFKPNTLFQANRQLTDHKADAINNELKRGYEEGYKEANEKVQSEWSQKLSLIDEIADSLNAPLKEFDNLIQEKTTEIAIAIAKHIIRRELSIDSGQIVSAVKQAIELIPKDGEKINLHVNPKDVSQVNEIFSGNDVTSKYNIVQDPTIQVGGCKALTDYSLVDLTIEKQIGNIASQIFGDQRESR